MAKYKDQETNNIGWLNLQAKETNIRIVSEFERCDDHFIETPEDPDRNGFFVTCIGEDKGCQYCADPNVTRRAQFLVWVIDRDDDEIKILSYGWMVHEQISKYAKGEDKDFTGFTFENIPGYDIIIERTGEGIDTRHKVVPQKKKALAAGEKEAVSKTITSLADVADAKRAKVSLAKEAKEEEVKKPGSKGETGELDKIEYPEENNDPDDIPF